MRRSKQQGSDIAGDWSTTGTFLRKPAGGWLHEDGELQNGLYVNYSVQYLGSLIINSSMRTLQFNTRTQVTKEAILRLAENSGNVFIGKKKKVPKQVDKILGGMDVRWAGEVNLAISVDSLKISSEASGMVILNHSLPSISFASGGDGATADYIGYVAKDPVHGRACHVFECPRSSQFLLATIGQAFELRYKMYLTNSRSGVQPVEVGASWDRDAWSHSERSVGAGDRPGDGRVIHTTADIHPVSSFRNRRAQPAESIEEEEESRGIYSDIPELPEDLHSDLPPPDSIPPPIPSARYTLAERPPAAPRSNGHIPESRPHNPYDTMEMTTIPAASRGSGAAAASNSGGNLYEDAEFVRDNVTAAATNGTPRVHQEGDEYSDTFISIRQSRINDSLDQIDLTPPPRHHDYSNVPAPGGKESPLTKRKVPPKPTPFQRKDSPGQKPVPIMNRAELCGSNSPESAAAKHNMERPGSRNSPKPPARNSYDPPMALKSSKPPVKKKPSIPSTRPGMYDDPDEVIAAKKKMKPPAPVKPPRDNLHVVSSSDDLYDDVADDPEATYDLPEEGVYNTPEGVYDERGGIVVPPSPKFDDGIYMDSKGIPKKQPPPPGGLKMAAIAKALPELDPFAPLPQQRYFHGTLSRVEAEALLVHNGEYLIRESSKKPGQYVLTGMASGKPQHLLLMDKEGRVKSKDREFDSVPHLILHFTESKLPLVIGNSQVYLKKAIVNAFHNA